MRPLVGILAILLFSLSLDADQFLYNHLVKRESADWTLRNSSNPHWYENCSFVKDVDYTETLPYRAKGYCPICQQDVTFEAKNSWFRDHLLCPMCGSIPRERILMMVIDTIVPEWRTKKIHETSPANRGVSHRLHEESVHLTFSQYVGTSQPWCSALDSTRFPELPDSWKCINLDLSDMSCIASESFDLIISQDVFEHVLEPTPAFAEISRTLTTGGYHIFTVPLMAKHQLSRRCARLGENGEMEHLCGEPEYHGNPVDHKGALVTSRWGTDFLRKILVATDRNTFNFAVCPSSKLSRVIGAQNVAFSEVIVTQKFTKKTLEEHYSD